MNEFGFEFNSTPPAPSPLRFITDYCPTHGFRLGGRNDVKFKLDSGSFARNDGPRDILLGSR